MYDFDFYDKLLKRVGVAATTEVTYRDGPLWSKDLRRAWIWVGCDNQNAVRDLRDSMGKHRRRNAKRTRNSSSDTEGKITQEAKRDRLSVVMTDNNPDMEVVHESGVSQGMTGNPNTNMEGQNQHESGVSQALTDKLNAIMAGQNQLRTDINANFTRQAAQLAALIDAKLAGLRQELDGKLQTITDDLQEVQARVTALEARPPPPAARAPGGNMDAQELATLRRRLDAIESGVASESGRSRDTLIIKGLEEPAGETPDELMQKCGELLTHLQVTARAVAAQRIGTENQGRRPRIVAVSFTTIDDVKEVMRNKRKLKDIPAYSTVFIEPQRPAELRTLEANIRKLAKGHPTLEYHRGRLRDKSTTQGPTTGNN